MAASYPTTAKTFTPIVDGVDYPQATQVQTVYDEVAAIESALLGGLAHPLRFAAAPTLTIAGGIVTVAKGYSAVDTEAAAATDDLDTITVGTNVGEGSVIILRAANVAHVVTLKDGTGNLLLNGDYALSATDRTITLVYDGANWREVARSFTTGGATVSGTPANDQIAVWTSASAIEGTANLTQDSTGILTATSTAAAAWILNSTNAAGGILDVQRSGASYGKIGVSIGGGSTTDFGIVASGGGILYLRGGNAANGTLRIDGDSTRPNVDNVHTLGGASNRYVKLYAVSGTIDTSDRREKDDAGDCLGLDFITALTPRAFRWKRDRGYDTRLHFGLYAQDVQALAPAESAFIEDGDILGLNKGELTAPLIKAVQELAARVVHLEARAA